MKLSFFLTEYLTTFAFLFSILILKTVNKLIEIIPMKENAYDFDNTSIFHNFSDFTKNW